MLVPSSVPTATPTGMLRLARRLLHRAIETGAADAPLCMEGVDYCSTLLDRIDTGDIDAAQASDAACRVARAIIATMPREARHAV